MTSHCFPTTIIPSTIQSNTTTCVTKQVCSYETWLLVSRKKAINKRGGYKYNRRKEELILRETFLLNDVNILIWSITFSNMAWSRLNRKICCLSNCITYNQFLNYLKCILFPKRSMYDYFSRLKKNIGVSTLNFLICPGCLIMLFIVVFWLYRVSLLLLHFLLFFEVLWCYLIGSALRFVLFVSRDAL